MRAAEGKFLFAIALAKERERERDPPLQSSHVSECGCACVRATLWLEVSLM